MPIDPLGLGVRTIAYRHHSTYRIKVENPQGIERGVSEVHVNGQKQESDDIELRDDGRTHEVRVVLGDPEAKR